MAVDMSRLQRTVLDDAIRRAQIIQQSGAKQAAAEAWDHAARHAENFAALASTEAEKARRRATADELRMLAKKQEQQLRPAAPQSTAGGCSAEEADEFREAACRLVHKSGIRFEDIAGLKETTTEIQAAFALSLAKAPAGVDIPQMHSLLFYGPPGCGKTLLAAAVSNGLDATFFSVKVSDLLSRYFGDSPKMVQALYDEARSRGNSVIFLDEFDALATSRSGSDSSADRRLLVSLLTELDGLKEKDGGAQVLTIAATNRPWDLDDAILSRFEKTVYIPLPDAEARRRMLELHLNEKGYRVEISDEELIRQTNGLSGREISHLCKLMIKQMMQEANPNLAALAGKGRAAMESYSIRVEPLTLQHLQHARTQIQPRTTPEAIELFRRWANDGCS
ncbi:MAG: ATP-binding protein [Planctomycetaceae bacterium]|nr:ATP-binding protein [Planctomycetaceae bacterium]